MKKLGSSTFKGEFKIIKTFLTSLGFEEDRMGKHGSIWKHIEKNLTTNVTTSSSDYRWYKNWKSDFQFLYHLQSLLLVATLVIRFFSICFHILPCFPTLSSTNPKEVKKVLIILNSPLNVDFPNFFITKSHQV